MLNRRKHTKKKRNRDDDADEQEQFDWPMNLPILGAATPSPNSKSLQQKGRQRVEQVEVDDISSVSNPDNYDDYDDYDDEDEEEDLCVNIKTINVGFHKEEWGLPAVWSKTFPVKVYCGKKEFRIPLMKKGAGGAIRYRKHEINDFVSFDALLDSCVILVGEVDSSGKTRCGAHWGFYVQKGRKKKGTMIRKSDLESIEWQNKLGKGQTATLYIEWIRDENLIDCVCGSWDDDLPSQQVKSEILSIKNMSTATNIFTIDAGTKNNKKVMKASDAFKLFHNNTINTAATLSATGNIDPKMAVAMAYNNNLANGLENGGFIGRGSMPTQGFLQQYMDSMKLSKPFAATKKKKKEEPKDEIQAKEEELEADKSLRDDMENKYKILQQKFEEANAKLAEANMKLNAMSTVGTGMAASGTINPYFQGMNGGMAGMNGGMAGMNALPMMGMPTMMRNMHDYGYDNYSSRRRHSGRKRKRRRRRYSSDEDSDLEEDEDQ